MLKARSVYRNNRKGFSIIEAVVASAVVALAVTAVVQTSVVGTTTNAQARNLSKAVELATELHEYTLKVSFEDLVSETHSTPVDGDGNAITYGMSASDTWSQRITVTYRDPTNLTQVSATSTDVKYVAAEILCNEEVVYESSWLVLRKTTQQVAP